LRFKTVMKALEHVKVAVQHPRWEQQYAAKRTLQLLLNGDVYLELYRRHQPDFSCFICYGTDNLAHKFWQFHFPDDFGMDHATAAPLKDLLTDYYRECDALLGEILPLLGPQTTVAVVSDHGFTSIGVGGESHQRELRPKMSRIAAELSLTEKEVYWSSVATRGYFRPVPGAAGAAQACERIVDWLMRCEAVGGPRPFIATLRDDGQVEVAVNTDAALERGTPLLTPTGRLRFDELVDVEDRTGNHSIDGIMLWRGPAIRRGARIAPAHLVDVTPTLLHLHGLPIGADMKGRPIEEALTEEFRAEHEVERIESWDDQVAVTREDVGAGDDSAMKGYMNATGYIDSGDEERSSRDAALGPSRDGER
jgi:arylsulfatase A-like enzyme